MINYKFYIIINILFLIRAIKYNINIIFNHFIF